MFIPPLGYGFHSPTLAEADVWASIYNEAFNDNRSIEECFARIYGCEFLQ